MHYVKAPLTQLDLLNQVLRHFNIKAVMQNDQKRYMLTLKKLSMFIIAFTYLL